MWPIFPQCAPKVELRKVSSESHLTIHNVGELSDNKGSTERSKILIWHILDAKCMFWSESSFMNQSEFSKFIYIIIVEINSTIMTSTLTSIITTMSIYRQWLIVTWVFIYDSYIKNKNELTYVIKLWTFASQHVKQKGKNDVRRGEKTSLSTRTIR